MQNDVRISDTINSTFSSNICLFDSAKMKNSLALPLIEILNTHLMILQ